MLGVLSVAAVAAWPLTDDAADTVRGIALAVRAYLVLTLGDVVAKSSLAAAGVMLERPRRQSAEGEGVAFSLDPAADCATVWPCGAAAPHPPLRGDLSGEARERFCYRRR